MNTADDTRSRILAAARELFAVNGYKATSLADIAAAVGLTKTAVAYHFHPKDRLAAELTAPAADDMLALLAVDFAGDARAFAVELVDFAVRHRTVIRLLMEEIVGADEAPQGSPGEVIRTFRDEIFDRLAGPEPGDEARVRAWAVLGAVQWGVVQTMGLPQERVRELLIHTVKAI
ncbi:TetR/AcrR family transcriptional regulator [Nonomuraea rhizosphaerae]|uniref:TetR/AcrR family transcriptional regulator n=1 Tax=Nonomuraea rhizosphaerae TaxID=2665663 RepID=UPI001C5FF880|nr:TetR/AcrR family transcriptional regulator [Nonomuraea rhizosphaerae]